MVRRIPAPPKVPDAHDLTNVLAGIIGCVDLAMDTLAPGHPARRYLLAVKRSALDACGRVDAGAGVEETVSIDHAVTERRDPRPGTALVVEDEPLVQMSVRHYLERRGYEVLVANDAQGGTTLVEHADQRLDVLVVDMVLSDGATGFGLAMAARRARPDLDIVCMSALSSQALVSAGHLAPGVPILQKPFAEDELMAAIRRARDAPVAAP